MGREVKDYRKEYVLNRNKAEESDKQFLEGYCKDCDAFQQKTYPLIRCKFFKSAKVTALTPISCIGDESPIILSIAACELIVNPK